MEIIQNTPNTRKPMENSISFGDIFSQCLVRWRWIALSLGLSLGAATFYLLRTPAVYTRSASLLIKEEAKGKTIGGVESFGEYGLFQNNTNINNEMVSMQSPAVMTEVVKRLHLDVNYYLPGRFHRQVAYGSNLPATVSFFGLPENESVSFQLQLAPQGAFTLSHFQRQGEALEAEPLQGTMGDTLTTPVGRLLVQAAPGYAAGSSARLTVERHGLYGTVAAYRGKFTVAQPNQQASILELKVQDFSTQRAEDLLNTLISVYNENWVKDKNQIAVSTSAFIDERLSVIERELGHVEDNISAFKSENLMPDVQAASALYMQQSTATNAQIQALNNQLYMTRYVRNYLVGDAHRNELLPANSGIEDNNISSQISQYNTQLLQRNNLVANSSTENPLVIDMDQALDALRRAIVSTVDNHLVTLNAQLKTLQQTERQATSKLAANPNQAKYLLSVERQQKVKESLYLFLLQKREENELSQAFTAYNTRLITPPGGSNVPSAPVSNNILTLAFLLGLIVPVSAITLLELINSTVRGRKDLEGQSTPLVGEIPLYQHGPRRWLRRSVKDQEGNLVVVREGSRNVINEAFRVLRTNIEFMTRKDPSANVMAITSFNPGSGKSFLVINIAISLALKGKRVLVIDGDMRHATASAYVGSPKRGLSDYLSGAESQLKPLLVPHEVYSSLSILPVGTIPPNPTELLFDDRLGEAIQQLKQEFDFVFIDCPPVEIVADTQILNQFVDLTFFVVRVGLLERSMLEQLEDYYQTHKYKRPVMILNGTRANSGKYGYQYGYKSGYYYGGE